MTTPITHLVGPVLFRPDDHGYGFFTFNTRDGLWRSATYRLINRAHSDRIATLRGLAMAGAHIAVEVINNADEFDARIAALEAAHV